MDGLNEKNKPRFSIRKYTVMLRLFIVQEMGHGPRIKVHGSVT